MDNVKKRVSLNHLLYVRKEIVYYLEKLQHFIYLYMLCHLYIIKYCATYQIPNEMHQLGTCAIIVNFKL